MSKDANKTVFDLLKRICDEVVYTRDGFTAAGRMLLSTVMASLGLTGEEAYLLTVHYLNRIEWWKILEERYYLGMPRGVVRRALEGLVRKGMLSCVEGVIDFFITPRAISMLFGDEVPGGVSAPEEVDGHAPFFDRLADLPKEERLDWVSQNALLPFCSRYLRSYASELDDGGNALLLALCVQFVKSGIQPLAVDMEGSEMAVRSLLFRQLAVMLPDESESPRSRTSRLIISEPVCWTLFRGLGRFVGLAPSLSQEANLIFSGDIREKQLHFDAESQCEVDLLYRYASPETYGRIRERLQARNRSLGVTCLLYGAPGTGKTELARQLARATGRDIIAADLAKMTGSYVGESERHYRSIFRSYRYAACVSETPPILLLNEADGILSRRVEVGHYIDKMENGLQNILLEEMERFDGILIATTNLTVNMDEAFARRFLIRICFRKPDALARTAIWKEAVPELSPEDAARLGARFELSGAQIDKVAAGMDLRFVVEGRYPGIEELERMCREEELFATGGRRKRIGFD